MRYIIVGRSCLDRELHREGSWVATQSSCAGAAWCRYGGNAVGILPRNLEVRWIGIFVYPICCGDKIDIRITLATGSMHKDINPGGLRTCRHADGEGYMALHISPSGITCFPKVGMTFLTPSQYQKFYKMSTANGKIFTILELLTNLHTSEPVQRLWIWAYCEWRTDEFWQLHNILTVRGKIRMIAADLRAKGNPL